MKKVIYLLFTFNIACANNQINGNLVVADTTVSDNTVLPIVIIPNGVDFKKSPHNFYYHSSELYNERFVLTTDTIFLKEKNRIWLLNSHTQIPYFIMPGDTVYMSYGDREGIIVSSKNPQRDAELKLTEKLASETGVFYEIFGKKIPLKEKGLIPYDKNKVTEYLNLIKEKRLSIVNEEKNISSTFRKEINSLMEYAFYSDYAIVLFNYKKENIEAQELKEMVLRDLLPSIYATEFNDNYMCYWALKNATSIAVFNFLSYNANNNQELKKHLSFITENIEGKHKDFILSKVLYASIKYSKFTVDSSIINFYKQHNTSLYYDSLITELITEKAAMENLSQSSFSDALLPYNSTQQISINDVLKNNKNNLVLIDFWASWCSPCRAEMPDLKKLKQHFAGKNIVILSISTDENKKSWLKASEEENLTDSKSYLLIDKKSPFKDKYKIETIPRYILIGKDGNIISADAPRPSDPELKKLIEENL